MILKTKGKALIKELKDIIELSKFEDSLVRSELLTEITYKDKSYPIHAFHIGSTDPTTPVFHLVGGVHGLEKIGTHLIIAYLQHLFHRIKWSKELRESLKNKRIVAIPLINPVGMSHNLRSNGNGVDLMRNGPNESKEEFNIPLISGHRLSPKIPWYRGNENGVLEKESETLIDFVKEYLFQAEVSIALDIHSGFGIKDRLWYPYATSTERFHHFREMQNLIQIFEELYPHHVYIIEQQSDSYTVSGDLWDYLYELHYENYREDKKIFIPLCLEMGSWTWMRKNPKQVFNILGFYNPLIKHRHNRVMRRHLPMINFFSEVILNPEAWK